MQILYIDLPGSKTLPSRTALAISAGEGEYHAVTDLQAALGVIKEVSQLDIIVCNLAEREIFTHAREHHPKAENILVTDQPMRDYSSSLNGQEDQLLDHVVVNKLGSDWTIHELRVTIQKIMRKDIFGIGKYLASGTAVHKKTVTNSDDRDVYNALVMEFARKSSIGQHTAKMIFGITEELLMNAIYDAPVAAGRTVTQTLSRNSRIELQENEYAELSFGCDGEIFGVSVTDPFGALKRTKLFEYLKKVLMRRDSSNLIDNKKGGAGLGLFKILYSSHALICNVEPGKKTEIASLIDTRDHLRDFSKMARSIHYFEV